MITSVSTTETLPSELSETITPVITRVITPTEEIHAVLETTIVVETPNIPMISSPIEGKTISDLVDMISNPFLPPVEGSDDPHQGVDISDLDSLTNIALTGKEVQAIVGGQVVSVMSNRFPYGNAILIVSLEENLPDNLINNLMTTKKPFPFDVNTA